MNRDTNVTQESSNESQADGHTSSATPCADYVFASPNSYVTIASKRVSLHHDSNTGNVREIEGEWTCGLCGRATGSMWAAITHCNAKSQAIPENGGLMVPNNPIHIPTVPTDDDLDMANIASTPVRLPVIRLLARGFRRKGKPELAVILESMCDELEEARLILGDPTAKEPLGSISPKSGRTGRS